jgi:succinoglycan biosynthesis protein ExoM
VSAVLDQAVEVGDTSVLVIDNDPAASALALAVEFPSDRVRFVHEFAPGIVAARNRALDESAGADVLVFIDDDEVPHEGWLHSIVATWQRSGAAAVAGPVLSTFVVEPDPWITAGGFFVRRRLPTGTELTIAASGNLLLDLEQVRRAGVRFDGRFSVSGGSDSLFTSELHKRGYRMVWCDEATVADVVPPTRANRRWVLRRAVRSGNVSSRVALILTEGRRERLATRAVLLARSGARIVGGAVRLAIGTIARSVTHQARGSRMLARGIGMAAGAVGHTREDYGRP